MLRLFVAVDLPNAIRDLIVPMCDGITGARWSKPDQLHVTLRFLGAVPETDLDRIRQALATVQLPRFQLEVQRAGVFPPHTLRVEPAGLAGRGTSREGMARPSEASGAEEGVLGRRAERTRPGSHRQLPRVLWLGLAPTEPLCALKDKIDAVLGPDPESARRAFSPHLTLARFTSRPRDELANFLAAHGEFQTEPWPVHDFRLYKSTLRRTGAEHEVIETYPLG